MSRAASRPQRLRAVVSLIIVMLSWASIASADDDRAGRAQALFDEAKALRKQGKFEEACPKLRESQSLEPAVGTLLYLADCYEQLGRTGSAYKTFLEAEREAKRTGDDRADLARKSAREIEPRLHTISIRGGGRRVRIDGARLTAAERDKPVPVDPGTHTVEAQYRRREMVVREVEVKEPGSTVVVELPSDVETAPPPAAPPPPAPTESGDPGLGAQRIASIPVGILGIAGLAIGTGLAVVAKNKYDAAACDDTDQCTQEGLDARAKAIALANGATAAFVVGGTALGLGLVLWFAAPDESDANTARLHTSFGASLSGEW